MKNFRFVVVGLMLVLLVSGAAYAANMSFEEKKAVVEQKVEEGTLTQEAGTEFLAKMQARMAECGEECDGTCDGPAEDRERLGQLYQFGGFGFGAGEGAGNGMMNKGSNGDAEGLGQMKGNRGGGGAGNQGR